MASSILFSHAASNSTYSRALLYASVGSRGVCFFLVGMIVSLRQSLFSVCVPQLHGTPKVAAVTATTAMCKVDLVWI